jgi:hypothetical protein
MSFIDLAKKAALFLGSYYNHNNKEKVNDTDIELNAMNMSGVEVPIHVFEHGDLQYFINASEDLLDDPDVDLGITAVQIVPRSFYTADHRDEMSEGILSVLDHLGLHGVWSKEDIDNYIHGMAPMDQMASGYFVMFYKLKNAWLKKSITETQNDVQSLKNILFDMPTSVSF